MPSGSGVVVGLAHHDHVLELDALTQLLGEPHERLVDDERDVAGVRGDVRQLVDVQAEVQRVEHGPRRRHAEVRLEVPQMVPAQRADAVSATHAQPLEGGGEPPGPA